MPCTHNSTDIAALLETHFFARTDRVAVLAPWGKPHPAEPIDGLTQLIRAHIGDGKAKVHLRTRRGESVSSGRFRVGSYVPAVDGTTPWLCLDFDGGKDHADALVEPLGAAAVAIKRADALGIPAYLERSGGGAGWHVWVFFESGVSAADARRLGELLAPTDAICTSGRPADVHAARGIEIFPKQARPRKDGFGNMVWLPFWHGAAEDGNRFYDPHSDRPESIEPESFAAVAPAKVAEIISANSLKATPAAAPVASAASPITPAADDDRKRAWTAWRKDALAKLPLEAVYGQWLTGGRSGEHWLECRDPDSPTGDQDPSAGVALGTGEAERGSFHSFRTQETLSVFDFLVAQGAVGSMRDAVARIAGLSGVPVPSKPAPKKKTARSAARISAERPDDYSLDDTGNGLRFARQHREDLRYCPDFQRWHVWRGSHWAEDDDGEALRRAITTTLSIRREASETPDEDARETLLRWYSASRRRERLSAMIKIAEVLDGVPVRTAAFDADPDLVNFRNGTFDVRTGTLKPHTREDWQTKLAGCGYDPKCPTPLWERFLLDIMDGNQDLASYLEAAIGYSLTGHVFERKLLLLYGSGSNGKTTLLETIAALAGAYATGLPAAAVMEAAHGDGGDRAQPSIVALRGARTVMVKETKENQRLDVGLVKHLTGNEVITARTLYAEPISFMPAFTPWLATNHRPRINDTSDAIWHRLVLVPFDVQFTGDRADKELAGKLRAELPGIAARALAAWRDAGGRLPETPTAFRAATEVYRIENDWVLRFVKDCCFEDASASVDGPRLWNAYNAWCTREGERPVGRKTFSQRVATRWPLHRAKSARKFLGLGLQGDPRQLGFANESAPAADLDTEIGSNGINPANGVTLHEEVSPKCHRQEPHEYEASDTSTLVTLSPASFTCEGRHFDVTPPQDMPPLERKFSEQVSRSVEVSPEPVDLADLPNDEEVDD